MSSLHLISRLCGVAAALTALAFALSLWVMNMYLWHETFSIRVPTYNTSAIVTTRIDSGPGQFCFTVTDQTQCSANSGTFAVQD